MTISSATAQFDEYLVYARQRKRDHQQQMYQRQRSGISQAKRAAALLKQEFGVKQVFLFGSLLSPEFVHPDSDIDLAVWGLDRDRYYEAVGTLLCKVKGFNVDLIMLETVPDSLFNCVATQGVDL
jgi:predicted nucleotidyltransferase